MSKTLVIISGKGGTGKTSITASFAILAKDAVLADCDVDAADLHLILSPKVLEKQKFISGELATINLSTCIKCEECIKACVFSAIDKSYNIDPVSCEGCATCTLVCPVDAITMHPAECGVWMISDTRAGKMVHARLTPGKENSGKLVSLVRSKAKELSEKQGGKLIIIDGPPGIGCPVIASIGSTDLALIVTEPTVSGIHDLKRTLDLTKHFRVKASVVINKYDINKAASSEIENICKKLNIHLSGKISYSTDFVKAQLIGKSIVEYGNNAIADKISCIYENTMNYLTKE